MSILDGTAEVKLESELTAKSVEALMAEVARLRAENEALVKSKGKAAGSGIPVRVEANGFSKDYSLKLGIGDKGTVCVYGLGRFPASNYAMQWLALLAVAEHIRDYIKANAANLSWEKIPATENQA